MRVVEEALADEATSRDQFFIEAATKGNDLCEAVEILLKGPELKLKTLGPLKLPYQARFRNGDIEINREDDRIVCRKDSCDTIRVLRGCHQTVLAVDHSALP